MSKRFVALGDSFTEGVGDEDAGRPNGVRGWADRVADVMGAADPEFTYANLAVRGRLLPQVLGEQLERALAMKPDLVSLYAGGNDLMRPKVDIDALMRRYRAAVARLTNAGARVILFTGVDGGDDPVFRKMRGRVAIYNEHVRAIAAEHACVLGDMWNMRQLRDRRMWSPDRLHLNSAGHAEVAITVLDALGVPHSLERTVLGMAPLVDRRVRRAEDWKWAREHVVPWVMRRVRGESSGDVIRPRRPELLPPS
ncbi:SGNH/GDSL hydrolase family protein [Lentzea sp. NEAU-D7]|uniref:SGNH/GDSL hydrolase family protein n=1 Tax=Lentzea sp. NEAU-D7 TaxID=2994667 RepID=UPI00224AE713|nr:SGNH/GDSL hydrolase family protein [Lentzea sp. NEAU-D7]MCX2949333.1 SGNH/GDSL hydrolase family protein [Lentzea sp. NEAU-D7]